VMDERQVATEQAAIVHGGRSGGWGAALQGLQRGDSVSAFAGYFQAAASFFVAWRHVARNCVTDGQLPAGHRRCAILPMKDR